MRFLLTDEQRALARSLDAMLTAADTPAAVRAWSAGDHAPGRALCSRLAQAGVFALAVPEAYEGVGMLPVELAVSFVELGRHAVPGPVVETVATAALLTHLAEHGDTSPAKRLLPGLATGESTATLALSTAGCGPYALDADAATVTLVVSGEDAAGGWGDTVTGSGRATARTGAKPEAADGTGTGARAGTGARPGQATPRAAPRTEARPPTAAGTGTGARAGTGARPGQVTPRAGAKPVGPRAGAPGGSPHARLLIAPGHGPVHASADPARRLSVPGAGGEILAEGPHVAAAAAYAADVAAFATAAQALGVGLALLDRTVAHAKRRSQFGAAIGSFQAVKHRLADTLIGLEFARPLLYGAALSMAPADIAAAKATAGEAAYAAARTALQLHGAVGYTDELDLSLWLRKARPLRDAWGTPARCRARVLSG
ncbi:acyl-CoA dehydrogenase family protein [Streptomyces sp. NBC_01750]|uniref:acyl-CoA dehydrogenase family protein n=1 Tax=Streptomyces sp. NBC_01750 TaxID=2975928 RepID=UPI002DDB6407|nr:acyl-CoA dehydrogenase family protein [Streptomyces sp. NBC_01750]WSD32352.1 acyl-CoA/acyl-ACP dehydrogenase [Streptomyces sp. NBC_01750]